MKKRFVSNMMLILTALIWGLAFVAQKDASSYIGSFTFNGIRFMLGALSLVPVTFIFERHDLKDTKKLKSTLKYGVITGVILFIASTLQQIGININTQASKAGFITGIYTVLVPIFGIFIGKKAHLNTWVGAILAVGGLYLISIVGTPIIELGDLLLLIGAFFWAFHILAIDSFIDKVSAIKYSLIQFLTCSLLNLILVPFFELESFSAENILAAATPILFAGIMSSGIAYTLQIIGQKNSEPTEAAIILSLESVFCALGCAVILKEVLTPSAYIGCLFVFIGIVISQITPKKTI